MGAGEIFDEALTLYRDNAKLFLAVIWLPALIITAWSSIAVLAPFYFVEPTDATLGIALAWLLLTPLGLIAWAYQQAAITYAIAERYLGNPITAQDVRRGISGSIWRMIGSFLLVGAALFASICVFGMALGVAGAASDMSPYAAVVLLLFGSCSFLILVLFLAVLLAFVAPVIVVEQAGVWGAIVRSMRLSASRFFRTLGILILLGIVSVVLSLLAELAVSLTFLPFGGGQLFPEEPIISLSGVNALQEGVKLILSGALSILVVPFMSAAIVLTYFDIRIRNEAFDVDLLAKNLRREPAASEFLL